MSELDNLLSDLHTEVVTKLLAKIKSGDAVASDYEVARKILKDHKVIDIPAEGKPINELSKALRDDLPDFEEMRLAV